VGAVFALVVRFDVIPEFLPAFDALVEATLAGIREREDGTLAYLSSTVEGDPFARVFIEMYRDEAAFEEHETMPHTRRFLAEREAMLQSFRVEFLSPVSSLIRQPPDH
jgi:quinol monooxygenase YgiN